MKLVKIAIHDRVSSFSKRWIEYCQQNGISFQIVDCHATNIIDSLSDVDVLLWHFNHRSFEDTLIAKHVLRAVELSGKKVFPDSNTCWHFDNKIAQKYVLESIKAPCVPTDVFVNKKAALEWIQKADYPLVFKLSKGAGSYSVQLVRSRANAEKLVKKAFGSGFKPLGRYVSEMGISFKNTSHQRKIYLLKKAYKIPRFLRESHVINKMIGRERGYVYFQKFIPENKFDTRITVINGNCAFGFTRNVRPNDFRASGSGSINYDLKLIEPDAIKLSFDVAKKLKAQSIAFDFVRDSKGCFWITEISYGFDSRCVHQCSGYWDDQLIWHEGHKWPEDLIISDMIEQVKFQQ